MSKEQQKSLETQGLDSQDLDRQQQQLQLCKEVRQKIVANLLKDGILKESSSGVELQKLLEEEQRQHLEALQKTLISKKSQAEIQSAPTTQSQNQPKEQVKDQAKAKAEDKNKDQDKQKEPHPVVELFFPMKDRGANVLVEPDEKAIAAGKGRHYAKTGQHKRNALSLVLEAIVVIAVVLLLSIPLRAFVLEYYYIPSGSMLETLQIDDHILSEKVSYYFSSPKRGDIITFNGTKNEEGKVLIKRVIGVGGDTIDLRRGDVYVNGEKLDEPYTQGKQTNPLSNLENITYPYTVPEGELWVMGDNRSNSSDSRVFGSIPVANVTGHAFWRYWPFNSIGLL